VTHQAAMQGGTRQVRYGRLQRIKTVIQGQKRVAAEGDNDRLFLNRENR